MRVYRTTEREGERELKTELTIKEIILPTLEGQVTGSWFKYPLS